MASKSIRLLLAACVLSFASAAAMAEGPDAVPHAVTPCTPDDFTTVPIRYDVDFATEIQTIFNARCTGCHGAAGGMSLAAGSSFANIVGVNANNAAAAMPRVAVGNPENSFLFKKVNCTNLNGIAGQPYGLRMPRNQTALTIQQQALIFDWIAAGARATPGIPDRILVNGFDGVR